MQGDGHEQYFEWSMGPVNMKTKDEVQFRLKRDRREKGIETEERLKIEGKIDRRKVGDVLNREVK